MEQNSLQNRRDNSNDSQNIFHFAGFDQVKDFFVTIFKVSPEKQTQAFMSDFSLVHIEKLEYMLDLQQIVNLFNFLESLSLRIVLFLNPGSEKIAHVLRHNFPVFSENNLRFKSVRSVRGLLFGQNRKG